MTTKKEQNQTEITPARLRSWRLESKYSIPQAARLVGANRASWERWEKGLTKPSEEYVTRLRALINEERDFSNISSDALHFIMQLPQDFDHIHSQLAGLAFGSDEVQSHPFQSLAKKGPNCDSYSLQLLDLLFSSLYHRETTPPNRTRRFRQIRYLMGFTGYFIGRLQYSVDDFENENMSKGIGQIIAQLMGLRALLREESRRYADDLWSTAFDQLFLGYCLALDEQFWPEDIKLEQELLACAINSQEAFTYIVSELSGNDFCGKNAQIFSVIQQSGGPKVAKKRLGQDTVKHLDEIWSTLKAGYSGELGDVVHTASLVGLLALMRSAQEDLLRLVAECRNCNRTITPEILERFKKIVAEIQSLANSDEQDDESDEMGNSPENASK